MTLIIQQLNEWIKGKNLLCLIYLFIYKIKRNSEIFRNSDFNLKGCYGIPDSKIKQRLQPISNIKSKK